MRRIGRTRALSITIQRGPTPSFHGATLEGRKGSGDMAELERRSDVLLFTTAPVESDLDAIGPVSAEIFLRSNTAHTDLYLCLCDLTPGGRSTNVCDGYQRLRPDGSAGDVARKVSIEFWPTAYRFRRGHRMRIIVASGAHPRYARNPGSGEPLGDAITMVVAHQRILHGPEHPSSITPGGHFVTACRLGFSRARSRARFPRPGVVFGTADPR